jgi:hypothetical protein
MQPYIYATVYNAANTAIGDIFNFHELSLQRVLHGIGTATVSIPLTDNRIKALVDNGYRMAFYGGYGTATPTLIYDALISDRQYSNADGDLLYEVVLDERLAELTRRITPLEKQWTNVGANAVVNELLGYVGGGWTSSFTNDDWISLSASGGAVYDTLLQVVANFGFSLRYTGTTISIGAFGAVQDCSLWGGDMSAAPSAATQFFVSSLSTRVNDKDIITRIYPLMAAIGAGLDSGLRFASLNTPYAPVTDSNGNKYIFDAAAEAIYGIREQTIQYNWIAPIGDSIAALINAANMLYRVAAAQLDQFSTPQIIYDCVLVGADVFDLPFTVGDKVPLQYVFPAKTIPDVMGDFWVQEIIWQLPVSGQPSLRVVLTTINRPTQNGLSRYEDSVGELIDDTRDTKDNNRNRTLPEFNPPTEPPPPDGINDPLEEIPPAGGNVPTLPPAPDADDWCAAAVNMTDRFWDVMTAVNSALNSASDQAAFILALANNIDYLDNLAALSATRLNALWALKPDVATITTQLADAGDKTLFRTWLYCIRGGVTNDVVRNWVEDKSGYPTELTTLASNIATAISTATWATWRNAGAYVADAVTCVAYSCSANLADVVFWGTDGALFRTVNFTYSPILANTSPPALVGQIMDMKRAEDAKAYLLTYAASSDESTLWYTDDVMGQVVTWVSKQVVAGRYTRLGVASTAGAGWIYSPRLTGWVQIYDFTTSNGGWTPEVLEGDNAATYIAATGWRYVDLTQATGRRLAINRTFVADSTITRVLADFAYTRGSVDLALLPNSAAIRWQINNVNFAGANIIPDPSLGTDWDEIVNENVVNGGVIKFILRSSYDNAPIVFNGNALVTRLEFQGTGVNPFTGDESVIAATRHFTSDGDTIADPVSIGTAYAADVDGAFSDFGNVVFAADATRIRRTTLGGAYSNYQTIADVVAIAPNSTTTAAYATATTLYYDGTARTVNDGSANAAPIGNRCLTYATTRLFLLALFGTSAKVAYSDDNGATSSFRAVDNAASCIAARATDELYVGTFDADGLTQYGDPMGALTDVTDFTAPALTRFLVLS